MSTATVTVAQAAQVFAAIGHPARVDILLELAKGEPLSPNGYRDLKIAAILDASPRLNRQQAAKLADAQGHTLGAVAYHFRTLHLGSRRVPAKLILLARETRVRGAVEHHYKIGAAGQRAIAPIA